MRRALLGCGLLVAFVGLGCPVEEPPPVQAVSIGTVVGDGVYILDPDAVSIGGARVEVYGTPLSAVSEVGKGFVLTGVPVSARAHVVQIVDETTGRAKRIEVTVGAPYQTINLDTGDTTLGEPATASGTVSISGQTDLQGTTAYLVGGNQRQQQDVGSDGTFTLGNLPPGAGQIAVSRPGYETYLASVDLQEGANDLGAITLEASSVDDLRISSRVQLVGRNDHQGVAVLLNGGEQITTTDEQGAYSFSGLTPGLYSVRAEAAGFRSMELASVALTSDGAAEGLVDSYLAPGNDAGDVVIENPEERGLFAEMVTPSNGQIFETMKTINFVANGFDQGATLPGSSINWTKQLLDPNDPDTPIDPLGSGDALAITNLTAGDWRISATATAADGVESRPVEVVITVLPFDYGLFVEIDSPALGANYDEGSPVNLTSTILVRDDAEVDTSIADSDIVWSYRASNTQDAWTQVATGEDTVASGLPGGDLDFRVEVSAGGGAVTAFDEVFGVFLRPLAPQLLDELSGASLGGLDVQGGLLSIFEGQYGDVRLRVDHPVDGDIGQSAVWASDTGIAFTGAVVDFLTLPAGVHNFVITLTDSQSNSFELTLTIEVVSEPFEVAIIAPRLVGEDPMAPDPPPYFTDFGVPLRAGFSHPFQNAFPPNNARWYLVQGDNELLIANGLVSRTFALPPGQGVLRFELEDAAGNLASATTEYVVQQIDFTATFVQPLDGIDVLEGTSVTASVDYSHTLVGSEIQESDLEVRYFSSIDGFLQDDGGTSVFGVTDQPSFDNLTFGSHLLSVSIRDGQGRIASDTRTIIVRSPGLVGTLLSPVQDGLVLFPGSTALNLDVNVAFDNQVSPLFTWKIDEVEFPSTWDDYGTDNENPGRATIDLGTFNPGVAPFDDTTTTWSEGSHVLEFFARLPEVDTQYGGACVNIPQKAICIRFNVYAAGGDPDVCATNGITRDITALEVWSGVKRLNCDIDIEAGGKLEIAPGTRVIAGFNADIQVNGGELVIGDPNGLNVEDVVIESQAVNPGRTYWDGIIHNATSAPVTMNNVILRHSDVMVDSAYSSNGVGIELNNVTCEECAYGLWDFCPDAHSNLTFRGVSNYAINEGPGKNCFADREWHDIEIENAAHGFNIEGAGGAAGDVYFNRISIKDVTGDGIYTGDGSLSKFEVRDSYFENVGGTDDNRAAIRAQGCRAVHAFDNEFRDGVNGIRTHGCGQTRVGPPRILAARNIFDGNKRGIYDQTTSNLALEVHLNSFTNTNNDISVTDEGWDGGEDVQAQGNFFGEVADVTRAGGTLMATQPGTSPNFPRIYDYRDNEDESRVIRLDNVLIDPVTSTDQLPLAYVREPQRTRRYKVDEGSCLPLVAGAPDRELDVLNPPDLPLDNAPDPLEPTDPDVRCAWFSIDDPADPDDVNRTQMLVDSDGCWDGAEAQGEGTHALVLECVTKETGRVDQHVVEYVIDNSAWNGPLWRNSTTWSGDVAVSGDVTVPVGKTLTVAPGATVTMLGGDTMREKRFPNVSGNHDTSPNATFGARIKVDIYVDGTMNVGAAGQDRATMRADGVLQAAGAWGGIRVWQGGVLNVENASLSGVGHAFHGMVTLDSNGVPAMSVADVDVSDANNIFRGTIPSTLDGIVGDRVSRIAYYAFATGGVTFSNSTFDGIGWSNASTTDPLFRLDSYDDVGANLQLVVDNVVLDRGFGTKRNRVFQVENSLFSALAIADSSFSDVGSFMVLDVNTNAASFQVSMTGSVLDGFERFAGINYGDRYTTVFLDDNVFRDGTYIFEDFGHGLTTTVTNNRIVDVSYIVEDLRLGDNIQNLTVTGNHIENAVRALDVRAYGPASSVHTADVTGNNFIGCPIVLDIDSNLGSSNVVDYDLSGNWWGTTDTAAIEAQIIDPQAQSVDPDHKGITDYSGYASSPLGLTVPALP
jgi:hypothetical protein